MQLANIRWRLDALDRAREKLERRVTGAEKSIQDIVRADEIAEAVANKLGSDRTIHLTKVQTRLAIVVALVGPIGSALVVKYA